MNVIVKMEGIVSSLTPRQRRVVLAFLLGGSTACVTLLKRSLQNAQKEQKRITKDLETVERQREQTRVDRTFFQRLRKILSICVPSPLSGEAGLVMLQGLFLVLRTLLTLQITKLEGHCARHLTSQNFSMFYRNCLQFTAVSVPAAVVNSLLKYFQKKLQVRFQSRLTKHMHAKYCSNRGYYRAAAHGRLTNADQRLTEDVDKFAFSISELYSYTFKPLLDVVLFTRALAPTMGYKGQFTMYSYYIVVAYILRTLSPSLSKMVAQEAALSGTFRNAHQRLSTRAEEIAYNDPPSGISEELILNDHLQRLLRYIQLSAFQRGVQQVFDGFFLKYMASVTTLLLYAVPLQMRKPSERGSQGTLTQEYVRDIRLLQNTSRGIADLILVYKRVTTLAAHTSRVSVLLEEMDNLAEGETSENSTIQSDPHLEHPPRRISGDRLKLEHVSLASPDGTVLVEDLSFEVSANSSVLLMGPNGSGKTSLVRVLAGLWNVQRGTVTTPPRSDVFYLSQQSYMVAGTLRDQLLYPDPPRQTWATASRADKRRFANIRGRGLGSVDDVRLTACLKSVGLDHLLARGHGWNQRQKWEETLSGGEKQRLAIARLLYHRPKFAILDEATSAVNMEGEYLLYTACQEAGISILSIGHRPSLKQFHQTIIHLGEQECPQKWRKEDANMSVKR